MKTLHRSPAVRGVLVAAALAGLSQLTGPPPVQAKDTIEPSWLKDLDIRQLPMAEIAVAPTNVQTVNSSDGMAIRTSLDRRDGKYRHGDTLKLTVDTNKDAYIWVLDTGTSGKVHQIFPNRYDDDNFLRAGSPLTIPRPDSTYHFAVNHPRGTELLTVIASRDNFPPTQGLIDHGVDAGAFLALHGTAVSVAKDISISLKKKHSVWSKQDQVLYIE